uniref:Uncharacterized protein n=1 Tax=Hyaloperonospora arabidopsidis (strain Emoy2) TaxID=559515 RepID=M4BJG8_HYAAE
MDTVLPVADERMKSIDFAETKHVQNEERSELSVILAGTIAELMTWDRSAMRGITGRAAKVVKKPGSAKEFVASMIKDKVMVEGHIVNMDKFVDLLEAGFSAKRMIGNTATWSRLC